MAVARPDEPPDPIQEEIDQLLADPAVQSDLAEAMGEIERDDRSNYVPHNEVRRRLGLPPLPSDEDPPPPAT